MGLKRRLLTIAPVAWLQAAANVALPKPKRSIFIVGCGHTGTSVLVRMLGQHSRIYARPFETGAFLGPSDQPTWYKLNALLIAFALSGRQILLEKTPRHLTRIDLIRRHLPSTTFVLTVRDGRDVVASLYERYGDFDKALARWRTATKIVLDEYRAADALLWKYEDFVTDPEGQLRRLCEQLEIPFEDDMPRFHEQPVPVRKHETDRHSVNRNSQLRRPIFDGRGRWKSLTTAQLSELSSGEAAALQEAFGYPTGAGESAQNAGLS